MENKFFKVSAVAAALTGALMAPQVMASTESAAGDQYVSALEEFLDGSSLSMVAVSDTRYRTHKIGQDADYEENLNYSDYNVAINFSSGYAQDTFGVNLAGYFSGSLYNNGACSEISQCDGWGQDETQNGSLKMTTASFKFKAGDSFRGDVGLTQMGVGTIGNVWSFVPGTYKGGKAFVDVGKFTLGYGAATAHTAPWWMTSKVDPNTNEANSSTFDFLHSVGLTGNVTDSVSTNLGFGQANLASSDESNTSYKVAFNYAADGFSLGYDLYAVNSDVDYDGMGAHHGVQFSMPVGDMSWDSQVRYTHTENSAEFTPRTVRGYGTNNGTWGQWWDAISDWNQDSQIAWSNRLNMTFDGGWHGYVGAIVSTISEDKVDFDAEYAVNGTVGYTVPAGAMKGTTMRLHVTHLVRDMTDGSDYAKEDFRFQVIIPHNFF